MSASRTRAERKSPPGKEGHSAGAHYWAVGPPQCCRVVRALASAS
ncbi:hypothetical protein OOU_Y34scaffold00192g10 [Pyricularia oryzae Y34]|uniref:Uncharacterized protein n=3 Tax=Pyricularia oryzae TaxID=318829 RepID=A0A4P7N8S7_PYROR|nr:hypothetical protein OOU_Y34scaffold00192g10 [Pyricularia oryzae Y34]QBZ58899.1 hypothetical protein PoMZ_03857 [Pyricularia oryzae]